MDLSLWEPPDDISYFQFAAAESNYDVGDAVNLGYNPDVIEEEFWNERSCVQVLKIWIDKADEEIIELEEDILMLKCQLAWDDVDWSKLCSAALIEKINHLVILIQSLENEMSEDVQHLSFQILKQPENLAQRLHELLKPLLENYLLVKSRKKKDAITSEDIANILTQAAEKSGKATNKLNELYEKLVSNSAQVQSRKFSSVKAELSPLQPPDSTEKASTASIASSRREVTDRKTTEKEVLEIKVVRPKLEHEETNKVADTKCPIMKNTKSGNIIHSQQRHQTLEINQAEPISAPTMGEKKSKPSGMDCDPLNTIGKKSLGTHSQQRHQTLEINQAEPISAPTMGEKKSKPSEMDCDPSSTIVKKSLGTHSQQRRQTLETNQAEPISALTMGEKKTKPSGMACNPLSTTVKKSSGTHSQKRRQTLKKNQAGPISALTIGEENAKQSGMDCDPFLSTIAKKSVGTKITGKYTLLVLKDIAKNRNLKGISKLKKKELLELLGLEEELLHKEEQRV